MKNHIRALVLASLACSPFAHSVARAQAAASSPRPVEESVVLLDVFDVSGGTTEGYGVTAFSSATRLKTPILDVPQSVSIVTSALMEDIGAVDYAQAVAYVPGVSYRQNVSDGTVIRGFDAFNVYRNGFRMSNYVSDNVSLDRIEIIKGPAAAIAGASEPGGLVNRITKKPRDKRHASLRTTVGSYGMLRGELDVGGPVSPARGNLAYRVVVGAQDGGGWRDVEEVRKLSVNPSLNWRIGSRTNLLVEGEYLDATTTSNEGAVYLPFLPTVATGAFRNPTGATPTVSFERRWAPTSFNTNDRKLEGRVQEVANLFVTLTHAFSEHVSVRQTLMGQSIDTETPKVRAGHDQYIGADGGLYVPRTYQLNPNQTERVSAQGDLVVTYEVFGIRSQTLAGYEFTRVDTDNILRIGAIADINVYAPDNDVPLGAAALTQSQTTDNRSLSYFINHQSRIWQDRVVVTGGLRRDTASGRRQVDRINNRAVTSPDPADLDSPMYGITLKPRPWLAFYASHSEAGAPLRQVPRFPNIPSADPRQEFFGAESTRTNDEFGVKTELLNGKLTVSLARFDTVSKDAVRGNLEPSAPGQAINVLEPGNQARGWELEFFGNPLPRVTLIGGYARIKTNTVTGQEIRGVPGDKFTAFAAYDLRNEQRNGFRIKGGIVYQTSMMGSSDNAYRLPGGQVFDAGIDYTMRQWNFSLNVNNLTDEVLPLYAIAPSSNTVAPPRTILFSVQRRF